MADQDFELITFDCYGTLIDWEAGIVAAFQSQAARHGVELEADRIIETYMAVEPQIESGSYVPYREVLTRAAEKIADGLGWQMKPGDADFLAASLSGWRPFSDTKPALERLSGRFRLGVLSNVDDDLLRATLSQFTTKFDLIVTAEQVRSYKPAHAHFLEARSRMGEKRWLHAAQSYFHDVIPASELHIPVAWVNRKGERASGGGPQPTYEVSNLAELANLLGA
ncbi:MAG TPA: HAD-IA family hydrolase [Blastocatellia bacterium]|jgi:2-haloacid dehalogenase/putative hydrolase of the HAD superfamily|nr:HAD-IA family hydrolase [Blastocatellia bacterium]